MAECSIFSESACLGVFLAGVLAGQLARRVEIETLIVVLLGLWHAGAPIMTSNGKSRPISEMKRIVLVTALLMALSLTGCLEFGEDVETTAPTQAQVDRCRSDMYLNRLTKITPLGYKLEGSGIDDAIWFKFETQSTKLSEVFDSKIVDVSGFMDGFELREVKDLKWWDVKGKRFHGGHVPLPNARFMNVGAEKTKEGYLIYIMWHET